MLPRSQHSVAVSLARIIAATRDIIHYTARFVNTFFQKNPVFFPAAPAPAESICGRPVLSGARAQTGAVHARFARLFNAWLAVLLRRFAFDHTCLWLRFRKRESDGEEWSAHRRWRFYCGVLRSITPVFGRASGSGNAMAKGETCTGAGGSAAAFCVRSRLSFSSLRKKRRLAMCHVSIPPWVGIVTGAFSNAVRLSGWFGSL